MVTDDVSILEYLEARRAALTDEELETVREGVRLLLGLDELGDPYAVPLHDLDWQDWEFHGPDDRVVEVRAATLTEAAVFPDHEGRLSLARPGDILLVAGEGEYALLRRGGTPDA